VQIDKSGFMFRNVLAILIGIIGMFNLVGYLTGSKILKGIGAASVISPLPKVFSDVNGLETFASTFMMEIETKSGQKIEKEITPELYVKLGGPYNRRNVYGAALSYAPRLPDALWQSVYCYGMREGGPLRREFNLPEDTARVRVLIRTKTRGRADSWVLDPSCF
jgi:hypothetical protein